MIAVFGFGDFLLRSLRSFAATNFRRARQIPWYREGDELDLKRLRSYPRFFTSSTLEGVFP
jgi:hypothetical protein